MGLFVGAITVDPLGMYPPTAFATPVVNHNRGYGYGVAGVTGTMAAALAQDSIVFALLNGPQASTPQADRLHVYLDRLRLAFTTIAAFTTPITAGRRLGIYRAAGGVASSGGAQLTVAAKDTNPLAPATVVTDARIATTAALTVAGITREAAPIGLLDLVHVGAAGARQDFLFELATPLNCEEAIAPGELFVVSNPVAMDAGGTWQLQVDECHWTEAKRFVK